MKNVLFFIITTLIIFSLNLFPLISHIRHTPPGRNFAMIHNNVQDFFFYQSLMNEGANGSWLTYDPYTTESHQSSIIFSYFLWIGKLSKIFGISLAVTYHLSRIILGIFFLIATYFLIHITFPKSKLTYLLFLFASPLMNGDKPFMNWWTGMDAIRRVAYLPHHMAGSLLLVLTIILIIKYSQTKLHKFIIYAIAVIPLLAFIHTPSLFILLLILPPTILIYFLLNKHVTFFPLLGYWITGFMTLLIILSQINRGFPWSQYINWEKNLQFPLTRELIGALGILFPFSVIGIWQALKSKKFEYILTACWLFVPFLIIPFAQKLNISNIRLIQGTPYLPLAILAMMGITTIERYLRKFSVLLGYWVTGLLVLLFIIFTYPTLSWSLKDQIREYWPIYGNVYLDDRLKYAFTFINQNFPPKTNTLSTFYTGNYLPAYTKTVSFIGHFGYTYNMEEKEKLVLKFFENKMTDEQAKDLIKNNKITLIFQGPEEKPIYKDYLYPKLLKPIYEKEEVTLYVLK